MDAGKVFDAVRELMRKLPEVFLGLMLIIPLVRGDHL